MPGVEILYQYEEVTKEIFSWQSFWVGIWIGLVVGIIFAVLNCISDWDWLGGLITCTIVGVFGALLIGFLSGAVIAPEPVEYETRYEVSVSSEVSMAEFTEKYEILETRGKIYLVREK